MKICVIINKVVEIIIALEFRAVLRGKIKRHRDNRKEPNSVLMRRLL
jgi:hypothetical protein